MSLKDDAYRMRAGWAAARSLGLRGRPTGDDIASARHSPRLQDRAGTKGSVRAAAMGSRGMESQAERVGCLLAVVVFRARRAANGVADGRVVSSSVRRSTEGEAASKAGQGRDEPERALEKRTVAGKKMAAATGWSRAGRGVVGNGVRRCVGR